MSHKIMEKWRILRTCPYNCTAHVLVCNVSSDFSGHFGASKLTCDVISVGNSVGLCSLVTTPMTRLSLLNHNLRMWVLFFKSSNSGLSLFLINKSTACRIEQRFLRQDSPLCQVFIAQADFSVHHFQSFEQQVRRLVTFQLKMMLRCSLLLLAIAGILS